MPDEKTHEDKPHKLTRKEILDALACPICKKPGALLDDKCRFCGSYQEEDGTWTVPTPKAKADAPKTEEAKKPWYEEEL